jgi:hypothetical protein
MDTIYVNRSERYDGLVDATLKDYQELNPDGIFKIVDDFIVEFYRNGSIREIVAIDKEALDA